MNKIERVRAMLRSQEVDRVPAGFWFHFPAEYRGGEPMARRHIEYLPSHRPRYHEGDERHGVCTCG